MLVCHAVAHLLDNLQYRAPSQVCNLDFAGMTMPSVELFSYRKFLPVEVVIWIFVRPMQKLSQDTAKLTKCHVHSLKTHPYNLTVCGVLIEALDLLLFIECPVKTVIMRLVARSDPRPTGIQEVAGSILRSTNIPLWILKSFLLPFSSYR